MKLLCFSVYDSAVKAYMPPYYGRAKGEAVRSFMQACSEEKSNFRVNAADFALFYIGVFDDSSGMFEPTKMPERVITAVECLPDEVFPPEKRLRGLPM